MDNSPKLKLDNVEAELELIRGDDEPLELRFSDEENENAPVDIRNYKIFLTVKVDRKDADTDAILQIKIDNHPFGEQGIAVIDVTENDWDTGYKGDPIPSGDYQFDIQYVDGDSKPKTIMIGTCKVVQDVSHGTTI